MRPLIPTVVAISLAGSVQAQQDSSLTALLDDTRLMIVDLPAMFGSERTSREQKRECFVLLDEIYSVRDRFPENLELAALSMNLDETCDVGVRTELNRMGLLYLLESVEADTIRYLNVPEDAVLQPVPLPEEPDVPETEPDLATQIRRCWIIPVGDVRTASVTVAFNVDEAGRVIGDVEQVSSTGPEEYAQDVFIAARRAILRCGAQGFSGLEPNARIEVAFSDSFVDVPNQALEAK